ncbi:cysteine proteinase [Metschnikowia bicuspidata var. bicuspidata NRRL YB-4993]|uniref:Cysteine proteinase n=1 Tax=Metschnikowia bicuspidata var. bicuspidata NRRL YB-4993 TaxID=869754 RepID=A0A1A0H5I0_9ASCO|nr:cysteine proteinase [Metschnikowia bicuspidata var. bicuspidata NRRL YB-4993]OBA19173.1 cysteine proteinase [Metschnikowia bicuspidata var. bicuspidata NRRL YB-4993]
MLYVLNPYKGLCFSPEAHKEQQPVHSDGLDQFDWSSVLPEIEIEISPSPPDEGTGQPRKKGKEARKERKEAKIQRKALHIAHVAHDKLARAGLTSSSSSDMEDFNPYLAKKRITDLYSQITRTTKGEEDTMLFQFGLVDLYKSDVSYLMPGQWLNDNNISLVYEMIIKYFLKGEDFGFHIHLIFPALTQLFLHFPVEEDLQGILPMKDLAKLKMVFFPFNFIDTDDYVDLEDVNNGDHWALCVLSIPARKLFVYDSMGFDGENDDKLLRKLASRLQKALFKPNEKITIVNKQCDQQENFDDCGVFLIMFSCYLISQLMSGEPTDLDLADVKFNPMLARLKITEIIHKLSLEAQKKKGDGLCLESFTSCKIFLNHKCLHVCSSSLGISSVVKVLEFVLQIHLPCFIIKRKIIEGILALMEENVGLTQTKY